MDMTFFTYKTNANRPGSARRYAKPYDRIVGIKSPKGHLWTPENDGYPQNNYKPQETIGRRLRLPSELGKRILQYFEDYFMTPPDVEAPSRTCHHFAQRIINPSTPEYAGEWVEDPANAAAQKIVQEGIRVNSKVTLPMGVVGVFGCVSEKSGRRIGYHSLVGMGPQPPVQVFGLEGTMGFSSLADSQERTEYLDQLPNTQLYIGKKDVVSLY